MFVSYLLIRTLTFPLAYLPYSVIHRLGKWLGKCAYHLFPTFRKRALSNLALAKDLNLTNSEIEQIAQASFATLMTTLLEYPKLSRETDISKIALCENPEIANSIMDQGKGVLFFCGHQSNWELLFLEGTSRMPGVAIGRPIQNPYLYSWIKKIREKFGGTIVAPKNALKEGLRGLKRGAFLGIVGDQGMPDSGFSSPFLGRLAWTSPAPAMLAYKTQTPIIVATTRFENDRYHINYSDPIYPNPDAPMETEVQRLMEKALSLFQESIQKRPQEWLWIHNRWKQQTLDILKRPYRHDSIALFLSEPPTDLPLIRTLYPTEEITLFVPKSLVSSITLNAEIHPYTDLKETLLEDYRFKLIYNFTKNPAIDTHYKKYATQHIAHPSSIADIQTLARHAPQ